MTRDLARIGSRIRTLRERYGISLTELGRRVVIDPSYLSRLERDALVGAKPKLDTLARILDALGANADEREAVFHVERAPLTRAEIQTTVTTIAHLMENSSYIAAVTDDHWNLWYLNRIGRLTLAYTVGDYIRVVGKNMLLAVIDPDIPRYSRVPDAQRAQIFAELARVFQILSAAREFDDWYLRIVARINEVPWAKQTWQGLARTKAPPMLDRFHTTVVHPSLGEMEFVGQSNRLVSNSRCDLAEYRPLDQETERKLAFLPAGGDLDYDWQTGLQSIPAIGP